jgi:hypothetical protein
MKTAKKLVERFITKLNYKSVEVQTKTMPELFEGQFNTQTVNCLFTLVS